MRNPARVKRPPNPHAVPLNAMMKAATLMDAPSAASTASSAMAPQLPPSPYGMTPVSEITSAGLDTTLGPRGYSIVKTGLSSKELQKVKQELMVKPFSLGQNPLFAPSFAVYRESPSRLYVPVHYGWRRFGPPQMLGLAQGEPIVAPRNQLAPQFELRPYQIPAADAFFETIRDKPCGGGLFHLPCGWGKTKIALYIIAKLGLKTLVVVQQGNLVHQWCDRIRETLPHARIGRIQADVVDVDDKDIVIGMLQSLWQKDYPITLFQSFGFLVVDEVHHIASESFSNALFRVVPRYTLGLSATIDRKDRTTYVFKMFLGDVVYKGDRPEKHKVVVQAIHYDAADDPAYRDLILDRNGRPMMSSMITRICEYTPRAQFLVFVLSELVRTRPGQHIMLLSHNKSLLQYLLEEVTRRNFAPVGLYVGGMKREALQETEGKQIVLATYAMAAEALDIPALSTLVMATPKTDVEQCIGRILRMVHAMPLVVDIVDAHDMFLAQHLKRKTYYRANNYRILSCAHNEYQPDDLSQWKVVFAPKEEHGETEEGGNGGSSNPNLDGNANGKRGRCGGGGGTKQARLAVPASSSSSSSSVSASSHPVARTMVSGVADDDEDEDVDRVDGLRRGVCLLPIRRPLATQSSLISPPPPPPTPVAPISSMLTSSSSICSSSVLPPPPPPPPSSFLRDDLVEEDEDEDDDDDEDVNDEEDEDEEDDEA